jgi:DNA-binding NarL/FixJ family response regulator
MAHSIFLIEDHPVMRSGLEMFVRGQEGLELCGSAGSAEEALDRLPCGADLVLVDVSLPGMSGIHLIREVRARWPELRCLVLSGHSVSRYAEAAQEAGAIDYVMKGDAGLLRAAIERALIDEVVSAQLVTGGH